MVPIRTLHPFREVKAPGESLTWNGMNGDGEAVSPGTYLVRILAIPTPTSQLVNYAVGRITVTS